MCATGCRHFPQPGKNPDQAGSRTSDLTAYKTSAYTTRLPGMMTEADSNALSTCQAARARVLAAPTVPLHPAGDHSVTAVTTVTQKVFRRPPDSLDRVSLMEQRCLYGQVTTGSPNSTFVLPYRNPESQYAIIKVMKTLSMLFRSLKTCTKG